jgi:hypothetical protein
MKIQSGINWETPFFAQCIAFKKKKKKRAMFEIITIRNEIAHASQIKK